MHVRGAVVEEISSRVFLKEVVKASQQTIHFLGIFIERLSDGRYFLQQAKYSEYVVDEFQRTYGAIRPRTTLASVTAGGPPRP